MASFLPLVIALGPPRRAPRRAATPAPPLDLTPPLRSPRTEALLREAMLAAVDLGPEWMPVHAASPDGSLFTATEYEALFIADLHVRLRNRESGEEVEQHVGVLPRWAVRHLRSGLAEEHTRGDSRERPERRARIQFAPFGEQALALSMPARDGGAAGEGGAAGVDAVILRRGAAVMALASWRGRKQAPRAGIDALAAAADAKWTRIAELLR